MIQVAVTGASGFVGTNLTAYLPQHSFVVQPVRFRIDTPAREFSSVNAIVHLGGKAHDTRNRSHESEYRHVNYELTCRLFDYFLQSDAEVFIFVSSVKAVADDAPEPVSEEMPANPGSVYGKTKRAAEEYILSKNWRGKRVYILRPAMIHGPGNKGNLNLLYAFVKKGLPYPLAAFENSRSFLSIENLCFVIRQMLERVDIESGIYHVADDLPLSTNRVVELIAQTLGKRTAAWRIPKKMVSAAARTGDVLRLPLNSERLRKMTGNYLVATRKLTTAIGKPLPVQAEQGIERTIRSFG